MSLVLRSRHVRVEEGMVWLSEVGPTDAPTILWLHGSGPGVTALSNWAEVLPNFSSEYHNIAPDIPGFGNSFHPDPPPVGLAEFTQFRAGALRELLDTMNIRRLSIVGNSMGGLIAVVLAMQIPERISGLVLMASAGAPVRPTADLLKLIRFYDTPTQDSMIELLESFVGDDAKGRLGVSELAADRLPVALRPDVRRSHLATFAKPEGMHIGPETLRSITAPALVVHGAEDRIMDVSGSHYLASHLGASTLVIVPNAGHWIQLEQQTVFIDLVGSFLQDLKRQKRC